MQETKPKILIKKYKSLFLAALSVEVVSYVVSLTDSIIAANRVSIDALSAIGLVSPFFFISVFIAGVINSGTIINYSYEIGKFNKKRAHEYFSEGIITAIASGILIAVSLLILRPIFVKTLNVSPEIIKFFNQYYKIIVFYLLIEPLSCLLDNIIVSDGGEYLSAVLNVLQIVGNVILSYILSEKHGVVGIAAATVACKAAFIILISIWFLGKKNSLVFLWYFSFSDLFQIIRRGIVRASSYATLSIMLWILNAFVLNNYNAESFKVWIIDQKILGLSTLFIGLTMTIQPMIGILRGEKNIKALKIILRILNRDIVLIGGLCSILIILFTTYVLHGFDVKEGKIFELAISALRITSVSLIFLAQMVLFFIYYYMIEKYRLALLIGLIKDIICPVGLVALIESFWDGNPYTLWIGLVVSQITAVSLTIIIIYMRYGKDLFPLLLPKDTSKIHIYSFELSKENAASMSETASEVLSTEGFSGNLLSLLGICIEDMLNLIIEKNQNSRKKMLAECTIISEEDGVRMILRDDGIIFNIEDGGMSNYSFTQYIVENILNRFDSKAYALTSGYNRNELFIAEKRRMEAQ